MKLGVCYNVFDGEELLEPSIRAIRAEVEYIVVVYQKISNFGNEARKGLERLLEQLKENGSINAYVEYTPKATFSEAGRVAWISEKETGEEELGGPLEGVGTQFFNEISKREYGREMCKKAGC